MPKLSLKISSPERLLFEDETSNILVPTKNGQITILPGHASLISELVSGEVIIGIEGKEDKVILVYGGFIYVHENSQVAILADSAEHIHEFSEKEAEEARKRAEDLLHEARDDKERYADAQAGLARSLSRLKLIRTHHSKRRRKLGN